MDHFSWIIWVRLECNHKSSEKKKLCTQKRKSQCNFVDRVIQPQENTMTIRNNQKWRKGCLSSPRELKALEFVLVILILDFNSPHLRKEKKKANLLFTLPSWGAGEMTQYVIGHAVYAENLNSIPSTQPGVLQLSTRESNTFFWPMCILSSCVHSYRML